MKLVIDAPTGEAVLEPYTVQELSELPALKAATPIELIQQLEADNPFTHRNLRDLTLGALKLAAMATGGKLEDNPAALKVMALEQQIAILRGEL